MCVCSSSTPFSPYNNKSVVHISKSKHKHNAPLVGEQTQTLWWTLGACHWWNNHMLCTSPTYQYPTQVNSPSSNCSRDMTCSCSFRCQPMNLTLWKSQGGTANNNNNNNNNNNRVRDFQLEYKTTVQAHNCPSISWNTCWESTQRKNMQNMQRNTLNKTQPSKDETQPSKDATIETKH